MNASYNSNTNNFSRNISHHPFYIACAPTLKLSSIYNFLICWCFYFEMWLLISGIWLLNLNRNFQVTFFKCCISSYFISNVNGVHFLASLLALDCITLCSFSKFEEIITIPHCWLNLQNAWHKRPLSTKCTNLLQANNKRKHPNGKMHKDYE